MKRLWCRKLRIPMYFIIILLIVQIFRYTFTTDDSEVYEKNLSPFSQDVMQKPLEVKLDDEDVNAKNRKDDLKRDPNHLLQKEDVFLDVVEFDSSDKRKLVSKSDDDKDFIERENELFEEIGDEIPGKENLEKYRENPDVNEVATIVNVKTEYLSTKSNQFKIHSVEKNEAHVIKHNLKITSSKAKLVAISNVLTNTSHQTVPALEQNNNSINIHEVILSNLTSVKILNNNTGIDGDAAKNVAISKGNMQNEIKENQQQLVPTNTSLSISTPSIKQSEAQNVNNSLPVKFVVQGSVQFNSSTTKKTSYNLTNTVQMEKSKQSQSGSSALKVYGPNWKSIDSRPLPSWYDDAKFGIFIHWGVFSVPGFFSEKIWWKWKGPEKDLSVGKYMNKFFPNVTYEDLAVNFTAKSFNACEWADLFRESGAKYVVLTSKHHEGYALWPSKYSKNWNSMEVGSHKDLVGMLEKAVRTRSNLKFGLYYSLFEWFNKLYLKDQETKFKTKDYVKRKVIPELMELVDQYEPDILWADGDFASSDYWQSTTFLAWLYNKSKVKNSVVTNDRWGDDVHCKHGDFVLCPPDSDRNISRKYRKWERAASIDRASWGYRRDASLKEFMTTEDILIMLVTTVSEGGNLLLNIGPDKDGIIPSIFQKRLLETGKWLGVNGEAIYSSRPWRTHNDSYTPAVRYTCKGSTIYAFLLFSSKGDLFLNSPIPSTSSKIYILGWKKPLIWSKVEHGGIKVKLPKECWSSGKCQRVATLKLENFK